MKTKRDVEAKREAETEWWSSFKSKLERSIQNCENRQVGEYLRHNRPELFQEIMNTMISDREMADRA